MHTLRARLVATLIISVGCTPPTPADKAPSTDDSAPPADSADTDPPPDTGHSAETGDTRGAVDSADSADSADTADTADSADSADTGAPDDPSGGLSWSWPELELDVADLAYTSTWTNGPCPTDTLIDRTGAHWDYRFTDGRYSAYADDYPVLTDAYGADTWYGADVWKVQTTILELQTDGVTVYSATVQTSYYVCQDDGVHLAGIETSYQDPSYHDVSAMIFDPPPLYLPADRTAGTTWSDDVAWSLWWWDERAYPDEGYRDGTATVSGTVVGTSSLTVPTGTYDALEVTVDDTTTQWVEDVGPARVGDELGHAELVWMSLP